MTLTSIKLMIKVHLIKNIRSAQAHTDDKKSIRSVQMHIDDQLKQKK
jgi:hypothetical protein